MMDTKAKAALERLRRLKNGECEPIVYGSPYYADAYYCDLYVAKNLALTDHPADDDEPASCEFFDDTLEFEWVYECRSAKGKLGFVEWSASGFCVGISNVFEFSSITKRQVRLLCEALVIPMKGGAA